MLYCYRLHGHPPHVSFECCIQEKCQFNMFFFSPINMALPTMDSRERVMGDVVTILMNLNENK